MDSAQTNEKPLLVEASGDFSHLKTVSYKNRFLYSKYNPLRTVTSLIQNANILPNTLIIVSSPCLWYGIKELKNKLAVDCKIIAIEADKNLYELSFLQKELEANDIPLFYGKNTDEIDSFLRNIVCDGSIRRVLNFDFSAGAKLEEQTYKSIINAAEEIISFFWKNRITLVKMGKLFSKNIFQNIKSFCNDLQLTDVSGTVSKPIIVCGAGESLNTTDIPKDSSVYVIAVDAALYPLLAKKVPVDAVIALESQLAIEKAYIGVNDFICNQNKKYTLFADITSRPAVIRNAPSKIVWFASKYTQANYLDNLNKNGIVKEYIPPLGSVGLSAVYIALKLRKDQNVPICVTGLDFSYSVGVTHAKNTLTHRFRLSNCNRYQPIENYNAAFAPGAFNFIDKSKNKMVTTKVMQSYAINFANQFANKKNLFDIGQTGIPLGIANVAKDFLQQFNSQSKTYSDNICIKAQNHLDFYKKEKEELLTIKDLLMHGEESTVRDKNITLNEQLTQLLCQKEYLYIHFPDGYKLSLEQSFLKRIRAEIDFFIKQIEIALI